MIICFLTTSLIIEAFQGVSNGLFLPVPQLKDVRGDGKNRTIHVLWTDPPSIIDKLQQVLYDIEVYNPEQIEPVHTDSVEKRPNLTVTHYWHWASPLPLECLPHSVKLRVRHHSNVSTTSDWTELRNVTGSGSDLSELKIYPTDDTVLVGIKKKICCIVPEGNTLKDFTYQIQLPSPSTISMLTNCTRVGQTYIFELTPEASKTGGDYLTCKASNQTETTVLFVGYSPEVHNFTCMTRNLILLECSWIQGRDINLQGLRKTNYFLNGSPCNIPISKPEPKCVIPITADQRNQVTWTLTAKNYINTTSFNYIFNPRNRVYLESPQHLQVDDINSKNANLKWKQWPLTNLTTLLMRCQKEETGIGLHGVALHNLHPYTNYSVRVRCAPAEHFWKWGDWSERSIQFQTKEDIPGLVDVWMAVDNSNSFVLWKKLSAEDSHGELTQYQVSWGDTVNRTLEPSENCLNMSKEGVGKTITVTASNSIGHSPPSIVKIPLPPADMETTHVNGSGGSLQLTWAPRRQASCGYVVDWYPMGRKKLCDISWIKTPADQTTVTIKSVVNGVRYIFSLYACTSDAPELLQKWEGYGQELAPDKFPIYFHGEQDGMDVLLSWDEIPPEQQRGFIQGYQINHFLTSLKNIGQHKPTIILGSQTKMRVRISDLLPDTYQFQIRAFTSVGSGPTTNLTVTLVSQTLKNVVHGIISIGCVIILATFFAIVCYKKRTWLKDMLYPDIPAPQLYCHTSKEIHDFQLLEIPKEYVEDMMDCDLVTEYQEITATHITESECVGPYRNVTGSDANITDCNAVSTLGSDIVALNNPTYSPLVAPPESHCPSPVISMDATQEYKPQAPLGACSSLLLSSDTYQALEDANQPDGCDFDLVESQTAVGLSQHLLGDQFRQTDNKHSQLAPCSDSYQALEDVCHVKCQLSGSLKTSLQGGQKEHTHTKKSQKGNGNLWE